jgi:hypothetical protein
MASLMDDLRSERVSQALDRAVATGDGAPFFELLRRGSGLPGPRPNLDLARAVGSALARHEARADRIVIELGRSSEEYLRVVAAMALAARSMPVPSGAPKRAPARIAEALDGLQELCEDPRHLVRAGVVEALRMRVAALGEAGVADLAAWTDGYFQAHVALSALADRPLLDALPRSEGVLARLEEAFVLADASPRSAERSQGMRTLRGGFPAQIAVFAARFPDTIAWLSQKAASKRPETREVVAGAVAALRRAVISDVEASRLSALLEASAKPRRDADRVVHGTRRRGRRGHA